MILEVGLQIGMLEKTRFYLTNDDHALIFTSEERRILQPYACIREVTVSGESAGSLRFKIVGGQGDVLTGSLADTKQARELFLTLRGQLGQRTVFRLDFEEGTDEK